ncbi:carbon-nitrogen hydrolase family protein [Desertibacillus haloalkaliphilus]|uniref:carbon-nitrogen hydrolase family protein n=1 Tax=Desertibacillus haloalkaliphilus TaxID=1328930 RepID=UPI001C27A639|nr:carbon-nitrogen hydrolase family protein [Desertibacillus haloalkaliphilus]MBU8906822.1 carbon-nitrogen hydrolase family protein [Desertibacillus haloalkaliphilus]
MKKLTISLLHLLPVAGDITYNQKLIEKAINVAATKQAGWIVTPELATSGLQFTNVVGTDWINEQPDEWLTHLSKVVQQANATLFLGSAERSSTGHLYNSVYVIDRQGKVIGKQRKLSAIDQWSSPGERIEPIEIDGIKTGIIICADAYPSEIASTLANKGTELLVAPSSWGPGLHGPTGEWEQRSCETGLPLFVCNRTGEDETVSFWEAESLVIHHDKRLLAHQSKQSACLTFDWDVDKNELISTTFDVDQLD